MDTNELMIKYEDYMQTIKRNSESTVKSYKSDLQHFIKSVGNPIQITRIDILNYINSISKELTPSSVKRKISAIQSLFNFMMEYEIVTKDISRKLPSPKIEKVVRDCPDDDTIEDIIANEKCEGARLAVMLGGYVGLRISETCNIKIENINFEKSTILLNDTKSAKSEEVMIDDRTLKYIKTYVDKLGLSRGGLLRTNNGILWQTSNLHKYLRGKMDFNYHMLRHATASRLANQCGISVAQKQLRHSDIKMTAKYIHVNGKEQLNALNGVRG